MIAVKRFLTELRQQGVLIYLQDGKLKTQAEKGAINAEQVAFIRANKEQIIEALEQEQQHKFQRADIPMVDSSKPMDLSFAQQRLWFIDQMEGQSEQYNITSALRFSGTLQYEVLQATIQQIMERHTVLRSRYLEVDGKPQQALSDADFSLTVEDANGWQEPQLMAAIEKEAELPFDLSKGPMLRVRLFKLAETEHVLVFSMHHIAADGWSIGILVKECVALYQQNSRQAQNKLSALPIQYADYAAWHNQHLQGETFSKSLIYWQEKLADLPALHQLPLDNPRPAHQSYSGNSVITQLPASVLTPLRQLAREQDCTMFMLLHSVFALLLGRWSNNNDVVIGTPVSGRSHPKTEALIGFFVNSLVLRTELDEQISFRTFLKNNRQALLADFEHQDVPVDLLVEKLQPQRNLSYTPLFQIMFEYASGRDEVTELEGMQVSAIDLAEHKVRVDLELSVTELDHELEIRWRFAEAIFAEKSIQSMATAFVSLLENLVNSPDIPCFDVPLLNASQQQALCEAEQFTRPYPTDKTLATLFSEQVQKNPNGIAIAQQERELSYQELDHKSQMIAQQLKQRGIQSGDMVGIGLQGGIEHVCAIVAIVKLGAAYVPLDAEYPAERLHLMVQDCDLKLAICSDEKMMALPESLPVLSVNNDVPDIAETASSAIVREQPMSPAQTTAYVMFTSGSTGKPKGVEISQQNVIRLAWQPDFADINASDVIANMSNMAFDASTFEIWGALLNGAKIQVLPKQTLLSPESLKACITAHQISTIFMTTAMFNQVARICPDAFAPLKTLLFGGEAVDNEAVGRILAAGKPQALMHVYGPTENCTFSTAYAIDKTQASSYPIGTAINGTQCMIVDTAGHPVPHGAVGELLVAGDGVAKGYIKRPELTAGRFMAFPLNPQLPCYRTGDLVRLDEHGEIVFVSRVDEQLKIRGFRVEPGEVVQQLNRLTQVRESAIRVTQDANGENQLIAYVLPEENTTAELVNRIKEQLNSRIPSYMMPSVIIPVASWPLNANGKIDKNALPLPSATTLQQAEYVAPANDVEQKVLAICAKLLKLPADSMSTTANFFELGGHSLLVVRLLADIREQWEQQLSIKDIFANPSVQGIAALIEDANAALSLPAITQVPIEEAGMPLSSAQQRLWFIDQVNPGDVQYNMPVILQVNGEFDVRRAERALQAILQRHQSLRTRFVAGPNGPLQRLQYEFDFTMPVSDLSALSAEQRYTQLHDAINEEYATSFNLQRDLMLRASYIQLAESQGMLLFNMHHIASDGWSMGILIDEFVRLYQADGSVEASDLAPLAVQYSDYAHWQTSIMKLDVFKAQEHYWQQHLNDMPLTHNLPLQGTRPEVKGSAAGQVIELLDADTAQQVHKLASQLQMTPFMLLHAALAMVLSRHSNQSDIVIGTPVANRMRSELEPLIGFFVNTLVLRANTAFDQVSDYLEHIRQINLEAQDAQDVPLDRIVELLKVERSMQHAPLFQITLSMDTNDSKPLALEGVNFELYEEQSFAVSKFDLEISVQPVDDALRVVWTYDKALFNHEQIEAISRHFNEILNAMLAEPDGKMATLTLFSETALADLFEKTNHGYCEANNTTPLYRHLESNAAAFPEQVALVCGEESITFAQLNQRSNQLARVLRHSGVGQETKVALLFDRSIDMVAAMLAVHKAQGAFVPLDPDYPDQRIKFMLEDSKIEHLITQELHKGRLTTLQLNHVWSMDNAADQTEMLVQNGDNLLLEYSPSMLAYVIYTSGSTGQPKGVEVEQGNLSSFMPCLNEQLADLGVSEQSPWLWHSPYTFDASLKGLLLLSQGRKVVLASEAQSQSPEQLMTLAAQHEIEVVNASPQLMAMLIDACPLYTSWRPHLIVSGEQISTELHQTLLTYGVQHGRHVLNAYGPTEGTINATYGLLTEQLNIGKPCSNTRAYILDKQLNPVPMGTQGQLFIAGQGVARGYLNQAEETQNRFVVDPFWESGQVMYKTGDVVRLMPDGNLEFIGRHDDQVKIRGFRIELSEVELAVLACSGVKEAKVLNVPDVQGTELLVAFIVADPLLSNDTGQLGNEIRGQLALQLPDYMIPGRMQFIENMPMTNSGKLDRKALREMKPDSIGTAYEAPETEIEMMLCSMWQELIGIEKVSVNDNFFQIGGHSLLAIRLASRIQEQFDFDVSLPDLFTVQTVKSMAAFIEQEMLLKHAVAPDLHKDNDEEQETLVI